MINFDKQKFQVRQIGGYFWFVVAIFLKFMCWKEKFQSDGPTSVVLLNFTGKRTNYMNCRITLLDCSTIIKKRNFGEKI